jgi:arylsulfatase A-like enzyme
MNRSGQWKYTYHTPPDAQHAPQRELYDLGADPMEFRNLSKDASQLQRVRSMHAALVKELGESDKPPDYAAPTAAER